LRDVNGFIAVKNDRIFYDTAGKGPDLLFLHAGIADRRMWDDEVRTFSKDHRVIRYDARGYGRSSAHTESFLYAEDAETVMDEVRSPAATLVGCSMGGRTAIELAVLDPDRVTGLVLIGPALRGHRWSDHIVAYGDAEDVFFEQGDMASLVELSLRTWVDGPHRPPAAVDPRLRERVADMLRKSYGTLLEAKDSLSDERSLEPAAAERLGSIEAPTLVIVGDRDVSDVILIAERVASEIPNARLEVVPDTAHLPTMERPDETARLIEGFLIEHGL
jgi:pimeloyl-ACP methyl ester carboxylesterase